MAFETTSLPWPVNSWAPFCFCQSEPSIHSIPTLLDSLSDLSSDIRFFAFSGTQVANTPAGGDSEDISSGPNPAQLLYISLVFGFSLAVNAWIFFRISGGLFNPAVGTPKLWDKKSSDIYTRSH